jgi:hypothetical protein
VWDMPDPREARATPKQKEAMAKALSPAQGSANAEQGTSASWRPQMGGCPLAANGRHAQTEAENAGSKAGNRD